MSSCPLCSQTTSVSVGEASGYSLSLCGGCGLHYCDPMPSEQVIRDYYANYWVNEKNAADGGRKIRKMRRLLGPMIQRAKATGGDFLDIGCNTGFACAAAQELGMRATGIDLSLDAIQKARALYPKNRFECVSLQELARRGQSYDFVLCREVIEHLPELHSFFAAMQAVVSPGGMLYVTTPDAGHFRVPRDFGSWKEVIPPEHICFFTRRSLQFALERYGFTVEKIFWKWKPSLRVLAKRL